MKITQAQKAIKESSQHFKRIEPGPKLCTAMEIDVPLWKAGEFKEKSEGVVLGKVLIAAAFRGWLSHLFFYQPGREN